MEKKISINLYVVGHHFPLKVTNKEEEILRKAEKLLNSKMKIWQNEVKYKGFGQEKMMAGAALTVVAELIEKMEIAGQDKIEENLEEIRIMLEDSIIDN